MNYQNFLCISQKHKPVPYRGNGVLREDGKDNYGFLCLKGALESVDVVPELVRDAGCGHSLSLPTARRQICYRSAA
jgi:hypothetical protein